MKLVACFASAVTGAPASIVYLPKGQQTISAKVDGVPQEIDVLVEESAVEALQAALEARQAENVRPYVDFDHEDTGPAAALPKRFYWDEQDGVMLELEWTGAGKDAVEAKNYSYFSPLFMIGDDGRPVGLHAQRPIGGLVNDPAFRNIRRIAAKNAQPTKNEKPMDLTKIVECGALTADQAKGDDAPNLIAAAFAKQADELKTANADLAARTKERDDARRELQARNEEKADQAVAAAVEAGRIKEKDVEARNFWRDLILEKGDIAVAQLEAKAVANPGIDRKIVTPEGGQAPESEAAVEARAAKVRNRAHEIVKARRVNWTTAYKLAAAELPAS